jgi:hypothetical protein
MRELNPVHRDIIKPLDRVLGIVGINQNPELINLIPEYNVGSEDTSFVA